MPAEPFYDDGQVTLYVGDCREIMPTLARVDAVVTDPPYGDTALDWDKAPVADWVAAAGRLANALWCFGSLRFHMAQAAAFEAAGWRYAQEIVWEKHNGSGFTTDRFKRVHEVALHWYRGPWQQVYSRVPLLAGERKRGVRRAQPAHRGTIGEASYDSDLRLERSVIYCRSEHGRAVHPTQKPLGIMRPLLTASVPPDGVVLDPFAGSGSTLIAARDQGKRAIGIELSEEYAAAAVARLSQASMGFDDPVAVASTSGRQQDGAA